MRRGWKAWAEDGVCIALILCIAVGAAMPLYAGAKIPLALQGIFFMPPWEEARPEGLEPLSSTHLIQHAQRYYPWFRFIQESAQRGDSLLWNPADGVGAPFFAMWKTRVLSPFTLPFYAFPLMEAFRLAFVLKLIAAGLCAYYVARRFGFGPGMALFVAGAFELSSGVCLWSAEPFSDAIVWLPLAILAAERAVLGAWHMWPAGAVAFALIGLGGDPAALALVILLTLFYTLARILIDPAHGSPRGAVMGLGLSLGVGMALLAIQLLPYMEYLGQTMASLRHSGDGIQLRDLAALLAPGILGHDRGDAFYTASLLHVGLVPLLLIPLWIAVRGGIEAALRARVEALVLAALITPAAAAIYDLVFPGRLTAAHGFLGVSFAFALLAATAAEAWVRLDADTIKLAFRRGMWLVPACWGVFLALMGIAAATQHGSAGATPWLIALASMAVAGLLLFKTLLRPNERLLGYSLALLTVAGLGWNVARHLPSTPDAQVFPETAFVGSLRDAGARVAGSAALKQWPLASQGVAAVYSPGGPELERRHAFAEAVDRSPLLMRRMGGEALLLTKDDIKGAFAPVRATMHIEKVYPAGAALFLDSGSARARMIYAGRRSHVLDASELAADRPPLIEGAYLSEEDLGAHAAARVRDGETNTRVTVEVDKTRPGILVLADTWYPGWTAVVDGKPAEVVPVDALFRGVEVGEGEHEIRFVYRPWGWRWGGAISALAALVLLYQTRRLYKSRRREHFY